MKTTCVVFIWLLATGIAAATTLNVPGEYATIQAAVNAATDGDTVLVAPGTYTETVTIRNAAIHLLSSGGPDVTIIQRTGSGNYGCLVVCNDSEIKGFHLSRSAAYYSDPTLRVLNGSPFIHHNLIRCGSEGPTCVQIANFSSPMFLNNTIYAYDDIADFQYGIHITDITATPTLKNNIVVCQGADFGPEYTVYNQAGATVNHSHNDFWTPFGSGLFGLTPGLGEIQSDPLWISGYHLQSNSPCIDIGIPPMLDPDLTRSDMGCFYYVQGEGSLNLALRPYNPPIQIPPVGGSFAYNIAISNTTLNSAVCQVWCDVTKPNGMQFGPVVGPATMTFAGGFTGNQDLTQVVPPDAPPGNYIFHSYAGNYPYNILDQSSFGFTKLNRGDGQVKGNWAIVPASFSQWSASAPEQRPVPETALMPATHPNPFNPATTIRFDLPQAGWVRLEVFDVTGRIVRARYASPLPLVNGWREAGSNEVTFDGSGLPSGVYIYWIHTGKFQASGKMVLIE